MIFSAAFHSNGADPYDGATGWQCLALFLRRIPRWWQSSAELYLDEIQITTLALVGISTALIGALLVLRRRAMLANSLAHTVLCGIVLAYAIEGLVNHSRDSLGGALSLSALWISATVAAVLTTWLDDGAQRYLRLAPESSNALVFSSLFALGVLLVSTIARDAHIGIEVIMGNADALLPQDALIAGVVCGLNALLCWLFLKEHAMAAFDPQFAKSLGVPTHWLDLALTLQTSLTLICAFRSVGSFLALAWLSGLPILALLGAESLGQLMVISSLIGVGVAVLSVCLTRHLLSVAQVALSTSGMSVAILVALQLALFAIQWTKRSR